jgi:hypothetical protein
MQRRAPREKTRGRTVPDAHPGNPCRAMVRVDGTAIRKKIKKDYEKALRDLDNSRRVLDQFHQTDLPLFTRWLNSHFGALLTELRELDQKTAADEAIILLVESEVLFGGISYGRAYKRVMENQDNPEPPRPPGGEQDGKRNPPWEEPESVNLDEEDPIEEFMHEFYRKFAPGEEPRGQHGSRAGQPIETAAPGHASKRLKGLYRAVVRRLHPDCQREMTAQKTEWWHQAQAAYEAGDAEQLEVILTLCDIGESGTTAHTSASLLQRITAQLKNSLREIKRQINQQRRDPAWKFSGRTDHAAMGDQMRREMMGELIAMRRRWKETQEMIAAWKAAAQQLKPPRRRKVQPQNQEFSF